MDPTLQFFVETFGPSGVFLGIAFITLRTILPWVKEYLQAQSAATSRIADAVEKMEGWQHTVNLRLDRIERLTDGTSRDVTGIYAILRKEQPSETARRAAQNGRTQEERR